MAGDQPNVGLHSRPAAAKKSAALSQNNQPTRRMGDPVHLRSDQRDPSLHSPLLSANRWRSLMFALAGCRYMFRYQKNTRIQLLATLLALVLAAWLAVSPVEWALIIIAASMVWLAEFFNAALEAAVNLAVADLHPMARVAKDVAAAAVLLAALTALAIGMLVLAPPLLIKLRAVIGLT